MKTASRKPGRCAVDPVVAELHRVRQVMFEESGGDIARYLELVRAAAARASAARRGRAASRQPATNG